MLPQQEVPYYRKRWRNRLADFISASVKSNGVRKPWTESYKRLALQVCLQLTIMGELSICGPAFPPVHPAVNNSTASLYLGLYFCLLPLSRWFNNSRQTAAQKEPLPAVKVVLPTHSLTLSDHVSSPLVVLEMLALMQAMLADGKAD